MKSPIPGAAIFAACLVMFSAPGAGAPSSSALSAPLHLTAPSPSFDPIAGGGVAPRIAGFGATARPGELPLPRRVLLVAIPEGSIPELVVRWAPPRTFEGIDIVPAPRRRVLDRGAVEARAGGRRDALDGGSNATSGDGSPDLERDEYVADERVDASDADFPAAPLRLGAVGYLREQRFIEIIWTPLVYNPARRQARHFPVIDAEVRFGAPVAGPTAPPAYGRDRHFEDAYRTAFVNYEQGRAFRAPRGLDRGRGRGRQATIGGIGEAPGVLASPDDTLDGAAATGGVTATATSPCDLAPAGTPRLEIAVTTEAIHRLDQPVVATRAADLAGLDPSTFVLCTEGVEVPIAIRSSGGGPGDGDGRFDAGDTIEFYGRPKSEPPTRLNKLFEGGFPSVYQANDFTDTQVYWLTSSPGARARIAEVSGAPVNATFPVAADFEHTAIWDENNIYLPLDDADPFFSIPSLLAASAQAQRDLSLALPGLAATAATAEVSVRVRGGSDVAVAGDDHRLRAWLNSDTAGAQETTWNGETMATLVLAPPQSALTDPLVVHLSAPGLAGVSVDRMYADTVRVRYRRRFAALADALLFSYPNQDVRFQITGFTGSAGAIYDISRDVAGSGEASPVRITGASALSSGTTYLFDAPRDAAPGAPGQRRFAVAGPGGIVRIAAGAVTRAAGPLLKDGANAADYLVIGTPETMSTAAGGALDRLLQHRAAQGLTTKTVLVGQIYEEFGEGRRDPGAIRAFLNYAFDNWSGPAGTAAPPSFVLLVGDATPDYKNTLGLADYVDQVPTSMMFHRNSTLGYYSSDNDLAAFRGDDALPDIHLGRISTRSVAESGAVFDKIRRYEEAPPAGLWKGRAILAASEGKNVLETDSFESLQNQAAAQYFATPPFSVPSPPLYYSRPPWNASDPAGFGTALSGAIEQGAAIFSYVGHGSFDVFGTQSVLFGNADAQALRNGALLPLMVNVNCLAGGFHFLLGSGSLGEAMTNSPGGGAVATFAPSGLSNEYVGAVVYDGLLAPLFGPGRERIVGRAADNVRIGFAGGGHYLDLQSYTLLGDPATVLATPAPPPPTGVSAAAGNGEVVLTWTPPAEAVAGTRVERASSSPANPYTVVSCTSLGTASCADRSVINATTYYYRLASVDAEGFPGRVSNFNGDCDAGPDCVVARPINPGPPAAPTGIVALDAGTGGRLDVSWNRNAETDIKSYLLKWGTAPAPTTTIVLPATTTTQVLVGLTDSVRYYFVVSALNTSGHESAPSPEVTGVPHLIQGIAPPRAIDDLMLARIGDDVRLSWTRPAADIYGRPTTIAGYRVYRGAAPGFQPFAAAPVAVLNDPAATAWTDAAAATSTQPAYYLVTAVDAAGLTSGAGRELPSGIDTLEVSFPAPGTVRLSWPAVGTDMQGLPTLIDHYAVYAGDRPLPRSSLDFRNLLVDNVRTLSVDFTPTAGTQYYSVIAVDNRGNLSPY